MFITFSASVQGESHKKNPGAPKPCEDSSGAFTKNVLHNGTACKTALAVVADGHGGDKYLRSRFGSNIAVETAKEEIAKFIVETAKDGKGFFDPEAQTGADKAMGHNKNLVLLEKKIIRSWQQKVETHIQDNPLSPEEIAFCAEKGIAIDKDGPGFDMYGTTLIAVLVTDFFWFALHIGDGACVVIRNDGKAEAAVEDDNEQGFGTTHSLCNSDAAEHFRHNFGFETLLGATAASDGVTDSYSTEKYLEFTVTNLLKNLVEDPEESKKELETQFLPLLSQKGSQDDVSLACVFNAGAAKPVLASIVEKAKNDLKLKVLERDLTQKQGELDRMTQDRDTWQKETGNWKIRHTTEKDGRITAEANLKALQNELAAAKQENAGLEARLKQAEAGRAKAETELQKTAGNLEKTKDTLDEWEEKARKFAAAYTNEKRAREKAERERDDIKRDFGDIRKIYEKETGRILARDMLGRIVSRTAKPEAAPPPDDPVQPQAAPAPEKPAAPEIKAEPPAETVVSAASNDATEPSNPADTS